MRNSGIPRQTGKTSYPEKGAHPENSRGTEDVRKNVKKLKRDAKFGGTRKIKEKRVLWKSGSSEKIGDTDEVQKNLKT